MAFAFTILAWILAYDSTVVVNTTLGQFKKQISSNAEPASSATKAPAGGDVTSDSEKAESEETPRQEALYILFFTGASGIVGGLVGGFVTIFGVSIANQRFRRFEFWMTTILVAGVLGALLEVARLGEHLAFFVLFTIWQAAVISLIARGMAYGDESATAA